MAGTLDNSCVASRGRSLFEIRHLFGTQHFIEVLRYKLFSQGANHPIFVKTDMARCKRLLYMVGGLRNPTVYNNFLQQTMPVKSLLPHGYLSFRGASASLACMKGSI